MNKKTLVIGASTNPERYSYKAVHKLKEHLHPVIPLGVKSGEISGINIETEKMNFENIDTVTLYVSSKNQEEYLNFIINLKPKRVIFNPGTENPAIYPLLNQNKIETLEACTLVLLSIGNY